MYVCMHYTVIITNTAASTSEVGDLGLAYQAFKIAISVDPNHAESYNNIGVLELRKEPKWSGVRMAMDGI